MYVRNTVIFLINLFIGVHLLSAAEIMYEKDWDRLVSGGQAARLTRGITEDPVSTNLSEKNNRDNI